VVLLARSAHAHRQLNTLFETRQVAKVYHALVAGSPPWQDTSLDLPLRPNGDRRHRTLPDPQDGLPSSTDFHLLERFTGYALLEAQPHTGRAHQVRAHLSTLGLPLLGDPLYGGPPALFLSQIKPGLTTRDNECPILARPALHARSLSLAHPLDISPLHFEAPYPKDFNAALRQLRRYTAASRRGDPA